MRAAIVECEDPSFVVDDEYRKVRPVHDQPPLSCNSSRLPARTKSVVSVSMKQPNAAIEGSLGAFPPQYRHPSPIVRGFSISRQLR